MTEGRDPRFAELDRLIAEEKTYRPVSIERHRVLRAPVGRPGGTARSRYGYAALDRLAERDRRAAEMERRQR